MLAASCLLSACAPLHLNALAAVCCVCEGELRARYLPCPVHTCPGCCALCFAVCVLRAVCPRVSCEHAACNPCPLHLPAPLHAVCRVPCAAGRAAWRAQRGGHRVRAIREGGVRERDHRRPHQHLLRVKLWDALCVRGGQMRARGFGAQSSRHLEERQACFSVLGRDAAACAGGMGPVLSVHTWM